MANVEFEGKDLEEAIAQAALALSLPPEKVKFTLLSMGAKGFLGLGRRKARISVDPADPALKDLGEETGGRTSAKPAPSPQPDRRPVPSAAAPEPERPRREKAEKPTEAAPDKKGRAPRDKERPPKEEKARVRPAEPEPAPLEWSHVAPPLTKPAPGESPAEIGDDLAGQLAVTALGEILTRMGLTAEISAQRLDSRLVLSLESPDNALLIGARGVTLEALQLLTGKIVARRLKEQDPESAAVPRVVLDVADYRLRRQNHLLDGLKTAAEEVRQTKKSQALGGLNSSERRMIQMALRPFKDLTVQTGARSDGLIIAKAASPPTRHRRPKGGSHLGKQGK